jgi:hypothetical protein
MFFQKRLSFHTSINQIAFFIYKVIYFVNKFNTIRIFAKYKLELPENYANYKIN